MPENGQRFFAGVYFTAFRFGATLTMLRFAFGIGLFFDFSFRQAIKAVRTARKAREKNQERYLDQKVVTDFFLKQELLPVTNYLPDLEMIKENGVKVGSNSGRETRLSASNVSRLSCFFCGYA